MQWLAHTVKIDHTDWQAAVERHDIASVHGKIDRRKQLLARRPEEILRCRLAASGGLEATMSQKGTYYLADDVVAGQRRRSAFIQEGDQRRRRWQFAQRSREDGREGVQIKQRMGIDSEHQGVVGKKRER